ncbi:hypothetical protein HDU87_004377 [Geranomyces variabilis]|uniref:Ion transport domain-containing protein n=1 Tax=Geranomyces variabilis TaxID=109894 RepID=A0AAD5TIW3_9FUNG|nr:hypothetical protein HDU87_004377 [Geranomyces variabilis]
MPNRDLGLGAELILPNDRVIMQSQELLEEMMRANDEGGSRGAASSRASYMPPPSNNSASFDSVRSKAERGDALFSNDRRRHVILKFVSFIGTAAAETGRISTGGGDGGAASLAQTLSRQQPTIINGYSIGESRNIIEAAFALGRWSMDRFNSVMRDVRGAAYGARPVEPLATYMESLNWAILSSSAADEGREDEEADLHVWNRFSLIYDNCHGPLPQPTDPESVLKLLDMRTKALDYFEREVKSELPKLGSDDLETMLLFITKFKTAPSLMDLVCPLAFQRLSEETIINEVIPRFLVLAVLQTDNVGAAMIKALLSRWKHFVCDSAANSALEYAAHMSRPACLRVLLDQLGDLLCAEGVISAMIPCCARGTDHLLAMLELFIMDQCQQLTEKNLRDGTTPAQPSSPAAIGTQEAFAELVPPCAYLFLVLAAGGGYAKPGTLSELIEFYNEPCAALLVDRVTPSQHTRFIEDLFYLACQLNFTAIVWTLIKAGWSPPDIVPTLQLAIQTGHQSLTHILLDSLLVADEKLQAPGGAVPLIFRKSRAVTLLPLIAQRFPSEASWFLANISSLPLPSCIPLGENQEAQVRATAVRGTRLGIATLGEVARRTDTLNPIAAIWKRLSTSAQLRRAAIDAGGVEAECVICMAPEALLTEYAVGVGSNFLRKTSPFIRLLETGNEEIILQPIMQALMEYHWVHGNFWYRFAGHFILSVTYIGCMWAMFILTIERQISDEVIHQHTILPLACTCLSLTALFLVQEFRECMDDPSHYFRSFSNIMDMMVYTSVMYTAIRGALSDLYVPPLLLAFTLVVYCMRVLMQLRIIPSIGPIIRIGVTATSNIIPVLVPFIVLAMSFAGAFNMIQKPLYADSTSISTFHFTSIPESLQSVLTMTAGDYSVLDFASDREVFVLRLLFHVIFIIFLINLIIGLMTVNVANVTVNTTSAWLVEIAQLMVELELYWPWPMGQRGAEISHKSNSSNNNSGSSSGGFRSSGNWLQRLFSRRSSRRSRKLVLPEHTADMSTTTPEIRITRTLGEDGDNNVSTETFDMDSPGFHASLQQRIVLYTCPEEQAAQTHWWKNAADKRPEDREDSGGGGSSTSRHSLNVHNGQPGIAGLFGLRGNNNGRVASIPTLAGMSQTSLPPVPATSDDPNSGMDIGPSSGIPRSSGGGGAGNGFYDSTIEDSDEAAFQDVRARRISRVGPPSQTDVLAARRSSFERSIASSSGNNLDQTTPGSGQQKDISEQLGVLREAFKTLEKIVLTDARGLRERASKLESTLQQDRQSAEAATVATTSQLRDLSDSVRQLVVAIMPLTRQSSTQQHSPGLEKVFERMEWTSPDG